jgi:hypothetical protein
MECGNPCTAADLYWLCKKGESRTGPIVIAGEEIRTLADANVRPDRHATVVINPGAFPQPHVVTDFKKPWVLYAYPRFADETMTNLSAKKPQNFRLEWRCHKPQDC